MMSCGLNQKKVRKIWQKIYKSNKSLRAKVIYTFLFNYEFLLPIRQLLNFALLLDFTIENVIPLGSKAVRPQHNKVKTHLYYWGERGSRSKEEQPCFTNELSSVRQSKCWSLMHTCLQGKWERRGGRNLKWGHQTHGLVSTETTEKPTILASEEAPW